METYAVCLDPESVTPRTVVRLALLRLHRAWRAAAGHRDWLVHDLERGIVRRERTRRAANAWSDRWAAYHQDPNLAFMVLPVDRCAVWGIDPDQPELYPGDAYAGGPA
ncbi:hypothetical protein [Streptacidiphilus jiangxiensis]|uniref:hypothetical protein n=1 Tax=Streptacidiphilus jiangxiensis TaxID=235985 RepID=UPI000B00A3FE|nr:hypothetical protein [Streptacidiphilus jiangxiensis]